MVTHDVDEAVLLADRIVMMTNGPAATIGEIVDDRPAAPARPRRARRRTRSITTTARRCSTSCIAARRTSDGGGVSRSTGGTRANSRRRLRSNAASDTRPRLVVVGNGMAGMRTRRGAARSSRPTRYDITVFGAEPHPNYNRILLVAGAGRRADARRASCSTIARVVRRERHHAARRQDDRADRPRAPRRRDGRRHRRDLRPAAARDRLRRRSSCRCPATTCPASSPIATSPTPRR